MLASDIFIHILEEEINKKNKLSVLQKAQNPVVQITEDSNNIQCYLDKTNEMEYRQMQNSYLIKRNKMQMFRMKNFWTGNST